MRFWSANKEKNPHIAQLKGGLIGFVVGDALGVPYEFKSREETKSADTMIGFGTHQQPTGSWSDDSSMMIQCIESLIEGYSTEKLKSRFCDWYYYGEWTHDHKLPFDIGRTTFKSLSKIKAGVSKGETGSLSDDENGNGSVMRVLPLAFYFHRKGNKVDYRLIEEVSGITHAQELSKIVCSVYVQFAFRLLQGDDPLLAYQNMIQEIQEEYKGFQSLDKLERLLLGGIHKESVDSIKSTGYVVDTIEATLWSFINSHSYKEAVLSAVRLGGDTDTIGAMTGGLAGMYYSFDSIPRKWRKKIARIEDIEEIITRFDNSLN